MAAIGYIRVSTKEQAKENYSLPNQDRRVRDFCSSKDWPVLEVFADRGESARTEDRPEFQRMIAYCRKNKKNVQQVVVADLSRFARNSRDQANFMFELQQIGIKVVSIDEPMIDDTPVGKFVLTLKGATNEMFSNELSEKTKFRMQEAVKRGRFPWVAPLGYLNNTKEKTIEVDPERGPLVADALKRVAKGEPSGKVLADINAMGLRTRRGDPVPKQTWGKMLANEIYCGWVVSGDLRVQGTHTPLISEKVFENIQERIGGKRSVPHQLVHDEFPLRGVVLCAGCQKPLTAGAVQGKKKKPYPRYWCWRKKKECSKRVGVGRDTLHAMFVGLLERMTPGTKGLGMIPEIAARELEARKERIAKDVEVLKKKIEDQNTLYQRAMDALLQGLFTKEDFKEKKAAIEAEKEELQSKLKGLDSEVPALEELKEQVRVQLFDLKKAWEKATTNQKHELVRGLFPNGLQYSSERGYFILEGTPLYSSVYAGLEKAAAEFPAESNFGVPDGI